MARYRYAIVHDPRSDSDKPVGVLVQGENEVLARWQPKVDLPVRISSLLPYADSETGMVSLIGPRGSMKQYFQAALSMFTPRFFYSEINDVDKSDPYVLLESLAKRYSLPESSLVGPE